VTRCEFCEIGSDETEVDMCRCGTMICEDCEKGQGNVDESGNTILCKLCE